MPFVASIDAAQRRNASLLCVGLDPEPAKFPTHLHGEPDAIFAFCRAIVDATADLVCCFKPQFAHFAALREEDALERLCDQSLPADVYDGRVSLVHIINRSNRREIQSKDFEFWRVSLDQHWRDGMRDARTAMDAESWREFSDPDTGLAVYDYMRSDNGDD